MARRALRKITGNFDLSRHLVVWDALPRPRRLLELLPGSGPVELEIGSGKGLFLLRATAEHPGHRFIGIEQARKYAQFTAARLAKAGRTNAVVVQGDARLILPEGLADGALHAVHIYFPDPWWKKRHHKRRIMTAEFLAHVVRGLAPGGSLHFWTDVEAYYRLGLETLGTFEELSGPVVPPEHTPAHDLDYRTHFERRVRLAGLPVYRSLFTKRQPTDSPPPRGKSSPT